MRVGDVARAIAARHALLERGFQVTAIRPPTVPPGGSRLRGTVSAAQIAAYIAELASALGAVTRAGSHA